MRKTLLPLLVVIILLSGSYLFYNFKINKTKKECYKNLSPKDLDPKSFIELFKERYNKTPINSKYMVGIFLKIG